MEVINKIYNDYKINNYNTHHLNKDISLPGKINIKNAVFYYVNYVYHNQINDDYFKTLASFVMIPNTHIIINNMTEFIDMIHYIKYNLESQFLILKKNKDVDFNSMKVRELKQYCRDNKIKKFSKYRKKELIEFIKINFKK